VKIYICISVQCIISQGVFKSHTDDVIISYVTYVRNVASMRFILDLFYNRIIVGNNVDNFEKRVSDGDAIYITFVPLTV